MYLIAYSLKARKHFQLQNFFQCESSAAHTQTHNRCNPQCVILADIVNMTKMHVPQGARVFVWASVRV